jgi:nucleotide-binding universal stress UspA family protein
MIPKRILVPIDFSAHSTQALSYAITMAQKLQARVILLHVIYTPSLAGADLTMQMATINNAAQQAMDECWQQVQTAGVQGERSICQGNPWQEIVAKAKEFQVDLIIMGTHGRTGLQHVFLGSVAEKVIRLAPCPVLVARTPAGKANA